MIEDMAAPAFHLILLKCSIKTGWPVIAASSGKRIHLFLNANRQMEKEKL